MSTTRSQARKTAQPVAAPAAILPPPEDPTLDIQQAQTNFTDAFQACLTRKTTVLSAVTVDDRDDELEAFVNEVVS